MIKKTAALYFSSIVVALYTTFVLKNLWNWFVAPSLNVPPISFWMMYGIVLFVGVFGVFGDIEAEHRHKIVAVMLDACVPPVRREDVTEVLEQINGQLWTDAGTKVFGRVLANTLTLGLGFAVHTLTS